MLRSDAGSLAGSNSCYIPSRLYENTGCSKVGPDIQFYSRPQM